MFFHQKLSSASQCNKLAQICFQQLQANKDYLFELKLGKKETVKKNPEKPEQTNK